MSCLINSGYTLPCDSPGGVAEWYAINYADIDTLTITGGEVTTLTLKTGTSAYRFQVDKQMSSFTDKAIGSVENKSYAREQTCEIRLAGNAKEQVELLELMGRGRVVMIAKLNDGTYELLFHEGGAKILDERQSGTNFDDFNGNILTTTHRQISKAPKVPDTIIASLTID